MPWGPGNFENDQAVGWLYRVFHMPLLGQIRAGVTHEDEKTGNEVLAAAEVLALVNEKIRSNYLHPVEVATWRDTFLRSWERYADQIKGPKGFEDARREQIAHTFGRLLALAEEARRRAVNESVDSPTNLEIVSEDYLPPEQRIPLQERLDQALRGANAGSVVAGESSESANDSGDRTRIVVLVTAYEDCVRILRRVLQAADVPSATWIRQAEPEAYFQVWFDDENPPIWGW